MKLTRILAALGVLTVVLLLLFAGFAQWWQEKEPSPFMVAAANPYATEAGAEILRQGGSAVDAAIAVQAVLSLVEPESSGLAGGAFMLHFDKGEDRLDAYDGRETAPKGATPELFLGENGEPLPFLDAMISGRSVGTPGVVKMLWLAHSEHGKLEWPGSSSPP